MKPDELPPGYPREYERELRLRDGRTVTVRPVLPSDAAQLAAADADTLRRRFLGAPPHATPALLTRLTTVDYVHRLALVAADPATGRALAIARYEPLYEGMAEASVAVDPEWRRAGLATAMIELLARAALERGIHAFGALYLAESRPVAALVRHAHGGGRQVIKDGIADVMVALDRALPAGVLTVASEGRRRGR